MFLQYVHCILVALMSMPHLQYSPVIYKPMKSIQIILVAPKLNQLNESFQHMLISSGQKRAHRSFNEECLNGSRLPYVMSFYTFFSYQLHMMFLVFYPLTPSSRKTQISQMCVVAVMIGGQSLLSYCSLGCIYANACLSSVAVLVLILFFQSASRIFLP